MAKAQNIFKARILDKGDNNPLVGAIVKIGPSQGGVTDLNGHVEIADLSNDTIYVRVSYVGYTPFEGTYVFPLQGVVDIPLEPGKELEEVVITSTRSSRTIDQVPTRIEVINSEEL